MEPAGHVALFKAHGGWHCSSMQYDFAIIGGGIAGLSAAAHLAPLGRTLVIEREDQLGYHASGRSAAMFLLDYGNDIVCALNHASDASHHAAGVLSQRDMLMLARAEDEAQLSLEERELGLSRISVADAKPLFPILNDAVVAHAAHRADAYDLDTDKLLQHYTRAARSADAQIVQRAEVSQITQAQTGWHLICADGRDFSALNIVNAAGGWADEIAQLAGLAPVGLTPFRRSMAQLPSPDGLNTDTWAFVDEVYERWYAKPQSGKLIVSPQEEDLVTPHDAFADDMVLAEGLARYEDLVSAPVTRVEHSWAGLRTFAHDRALVVGRDVAVPSFIWCAGQGGYGFQTAPAAAQLIGEIAAETRPALDPDIVAALSPERFAS